jgi:hypothetical protein
VGAVMAALVCMLAGTASAARATAPCWQRLTLDWAADGRVDRTYPLPCYQQAIAHLGSTDRVYSSAEDDIRRAQQRAIAGKSAGGPQTPTAAPDAPATGDGGGVPVPLLALGGVAILLVALGAVGFVRRRSSGDDAGAT